MINPGSAPNFPARFWGLLFVAGIGLVSCLSVVTPPPGKPLAVLPGKAMVYGSVTIHDRGRAVPPVNPGTDWASIGPGLRPELTLYLMRLSPRRIARPQFSGSGLFFWFLEPGEYLLLGKPTAEIAEPELEQHHWPLAALRVLPADGLVCAGEIFIELPVTGLSWEPTPVLHFYLGAVTVADQCAALTEELEARYPATDSGHAKRLLREAADLDFTDPSLFDRVRALLDAAR